MERVVILGCGGAGKSTLARTLGTRLGLPVVHLDQLWWKSGWENRTPEEFDALLDAAIAQPRWVMDGNYARTLSRRLARCDAVIFLDYPRRVCLLRALRRMASYRGVTRPDMAEGCPERWDPEFAHWIWNFHKHQRPLVYQALAGWGGSVHIFRSPRQCAAFLHRL